MPEEGGNTDFNRWKIVFRLPETLYPPKPKTRAEYSKVVVHVTPKPVSLAAFSGLRGRFVLLLMGRLGYCSGLQ
jgi:hypothetical protein